jgi:hypothetical protein
MEIIITLLIISQIFTFYLLWKKIPTVQPKVEIKEESKDIILKPIPKPIRVDEVEGFESTIKDILLSAKNENWESTIKLNHYTIGSDDYYTIYISSNDDEPISIDALVDLVGIDRPFDNIRLGRFWIKKSGSFTTVENTYLKNDLLVFLWDYILEDEMKKNQRQYDRFKENFENLRVSLKSLNRDRKLNELLNND